MIITQKRKEVQKDRKPIRKGNEETKKREERCKNRCKYLIVSNKTVSVTQV